MIERFAHILTRKPALVVLIALALLVPSVIAYIATPVNYDILTYLPADLDSTHGMDLLEEPFHMAATSMLIVENMPSGYTNELTEEIQKVPGVSNAVWLSNVVGVQIPTEFIPQQYRDMFYSGDGTMMIIQYEHPGASDETMNAIQQIRRLCNEKCFLAGFSVVVEDTRELVDQEMPLFVGLAVLLALIAMSLTMESWILPFVLLVNIGIAVIYNFGTNFLMGQISYITKAIAAVLQLGVTMDYSVFLYHAYEQEKPRFEDHKDAMAAAVVTAFRSLTGSSLTTIAGFLALCFMRFTLGKDIGIVMAKGVVLGVATVILVLPSLLLLADKWVAKWHHKPLIPDLEGLNERTIRRRWVFVLIAAILFVPAVYAKNNAAVYYKLDESLPQDLPSIVANHRLKDEFGMSVSHFAIVSDDLTAAQLSEMEGRIEAVEGVTDLISYHKLLGSGIPEFFVPEELRSMVKAGGHQLMMINSEYDTASDEVSQQVAQLRTILKDYDPDAMLTGEAVLTDDLIVTTAVDFRTTNYISMAAIFLIIAIVFKSVTVPLVLVAVIELAIFINLGIPYFTGSEVAFITPTVISCVQLGATVDYAILMTSRFQDELRAGKDRFEAIRIAAKASDPAIITSSLVMLCATLGVSFVSSIDLIGSICTMLARGSVISAVMSIVFLPAILCAAEPLFRRTSYKWLG